MHVIIFNREAPHHHQYAVCNKPGRITLRCLIIKINILLPFKVAAFWNNLAN